MKRPKNCYSIAFTQRRTMATCMAEPLCEKTYYLKATAPGSAQHVGYARIERPDSILVFTGAWKLVGTAKTRAEAAEMIDSYHRRKNSSRYWLWADRPLWCGGRVIRPAKRKAGRP